MKISKLIILLLLLVFIQPIQSVFATDRLPIELKKQLLLKQFSEAIPQLKILAAKGDNAARYQLAICYLNGDGVNHSVNQAVKLLREASKKGYSKASYLLGSMYYNGEEVSKDISASKSYLFIAAQKGHRLAKKLLRQIDDTGAGTSLSRNEAQQRLEYAARIGDKVRASDAIKYGADINQKNKQGRTPLLIASRNKQYKFISWFISKKPNLSITDNNKDTALHILAVSSDLALIEKLLKQGAKIDPINNNGRTPLINAVISENLGLIKSLLSRGANPRHQDKQGKSAFNYAENKNKNKNKNKIIAFFKPYMSNKNKQKDLMQRLQQLTKQTNKKNNLYYNWPMIAIVVAQNELELVDLLLLQGADPWEVTPSGNSAISIAVKDNHNKLALKLLKKTTINTKVKKKQALALLSLAASNNHFELIEQLSTMLPSTSPTQQAFLQTPLCHAINSTSQAAALKLIEWQQSDFRTDKRGRNLLHLAAREGLAQVVLALIKKGFDVNETDQYQRSALWYAAEFGHPKVFKTLLSQQANIHQFDNKGHTPLLRAVISNHFDIVSTSIEYGANVNLKTNNGNTALIFAADSKPKIINLLLTHSANVSVRNHLSLTPLMIAVTKKCLACVQLLIAADANPNRKNIKGKNSFDLAKGSIEITKILER